MKYTITPFQLFLKIVLDSLGQKYKDSASDLLNSPLPFHPSTMLAKGVSFLASNARKQHCMRREGDGSGYFPQDFS